MKSIVTSIKTFLCSHKAVLQILFTSTVKLTLQVVFVKLIKIAS